MSRGRALTLWLVASVAFAVYVANFGSYNQTYGTLGAIIILLIWLWITNLSLLLGIEFNSELERARELEAGQPAERELQLEPRRQPKRRSSKPTGRKSGSTRKQSRPTARTR